ncbi:hypothetical protein ACXX9E_28805 [Pseudomonas sp. GNP014]
MPIGRNQGARLHQRRQQSADAQRLRAVDGQGAAAGAVLSNLTKERNICAARRCGSACEASTSPWSTVPWYGVVSMRVRAATLLAWLL